MGARAAPSSSLASAVCKLTPLSKLAQLGWIRAQNTAIIWFAYRWGRCMTPQSPLFLLPQRGYKEVVCSLLILVGFSLQVVFRHIDRESVVGVFSAGSLSWYHKREGQWKSGSGYARWARDLCPALLDDRECDVSDAHRLSNLEVLPTDGAAPARFAQPPCCLCGPTPIVNTLRRVWADLTVSSQNTIPSTKTWLTELGQTDGKKARDEQRELNRGIRWSGSSTSDVTPPARWEGLQVALRANLALDPLRD